jgi:hypothetical protein
VESLASRVAALRVALGEFFVGEALEALALFSLVAACSRFIGVLCVIAGHKIIEVGAFQRIFFQREVFVSAQVVNPEFLCPRFFGCRFAVEEEDIRLDALGVDAATGDLPPEN